MHFVEYVTEFRSKDGTIVAESISTTIELDATPSVTGPEAPMTWKVGEELFNFVDPPVRRSYIVRYQGAAGDFNAVHHDDEVTQSLGYPGLVSIGTLHAGVLDGCLARALGAGRIRSLRVRFLALVWPGDVLTYEAIVAEFTGSGASRTAELEVRVRRQTGEIHLEGTATVFLPAAS